MTNITFIEAIEDIYTSLKSDLTNAFACDVDDVGDVVIHIERALGAAHRFLLDADEAAPKKRKHVRGLDISERFAAIDDLLIGLESRSDEIRECGEAASDIAVCIETALELANAIHEHLATLASEESEREADYAESTYRFATVGVW